MVIILLNHDTNDVQQSLFYFFLNPFLKLSEEDETTLNDGGESGKNRYIKAKQHQPHQSSGSGHSSKEPSPKKGEYQI